MKKKLLLDPFILQVIISNIPSTIVLGLIPVISKNMGASIIFIGVFFLLARTGMVVGSFFSTKLMSKWPPHVIGAVVEYANCLLSLVIFLSAIYEMNNLLIITGFFKGLVSGITGVLRFSWLRRLPDFKYNSQLNLITMAIQQGGYAIIGILLFCFQPERLTENLFLIDAATSILGAKFFWSMKKYGVKPLPQSTASMSNIFKISISSLPKKVLLGASLFLYAAMGGTNVLLVKYGEHLFGSTNGYAVALLVYGTFFFLGGQAIHWMKSNKDGIILNMRVTLSSLAVMFFSVLLMSVVKNYFLQVLMFGALFFFYIVGFLQMQSEWFRLSTPEDSSQMGSAQTLYSQLLFGLGEWGYSFLIDDYWLRSLFLLCSIMVMCFFKKYSGVRF